MRKDPFPATSTHSNACKHKRKMGKYAIAISNVTNLLTDALTLCAPCEVRIELNPPLSDKFVFCFKESRFDIITSPLVEPNRSN